jgi:hypothetical protein
MDDDDKIRRNLVVFSAAILLVAWLEIPIQALIDRAPAGATLKVSSLRAWGAAGVVLGYLVLRYRFSPFAKIERERPAVPS